MEKNSSLKKFETIFRLIGKLSDKKIIKKVVDDVNFKEFKEKDPYIKYFLNLAEYKEELVAKILENFELEDELFFYVLGETGKYFCFNHLNFRKPDYASMDSKQILNYIEISKGNVQACCTALKSGKLKENDIIEALKLGDWKNDVVSVVVEMVRTNKIVLDRYYRLKLIEGAKYCIADIVSKEDLNVPPEQLLSYVEETKNISIAKRALKTKKLSSEQAIKVLKLTKKGPHDPVGNSGLAKIVLEEFELSLSQKFEILGVADTFFDLGEVVLTRNKENLDRMSGEQLLDFCRFSGFDKHIVLYSVRSKKLKAEHFAELLSNTYLDCVRGPIEMAVKNL